MSWLGEGYETESLDPHMLFGLGNEKQNIWLILVQKSHSLERQVVVLNLDVFFLS